MQHVATTDCALGELLVPEEHANCSPFLLCLWLMTLQWTIFILEQYVFCINFNCSKTPYFYSVVGDKPDTSELHRDPCP